MRSSAEAETGKFPYHSRFSGNFPQISKYDFSQIETINELNELFHTEQTSPFGYWTLAGTDTGSN
jgi:hypothetical protein